MPRVGTLALIGGVFQVVGALMAVGTAMLLGALYHVAVNIAPLPIVGRTLLTLLVVGAIGVVVGIGSILIGVRLRSGTIDPQTGGVALIVLAIASLFTCFAGGFMIGFVLTLIDGAKALGA